MSVTGAPRNVWVATSANVGGNARSRPRSVVQLKSMQSSPEPTQTQRMTPSSSQSYLSHEAYAKKKVADAKACLSMLDPADNINNVRCGIELKQLPDKKPCKKLCHHTCFGGYCQKSGCTFDHSRVDTKGMTVLIPEYIRAPELYDGACTFASQLYALSQIKKLSVDDITIEDLVSRAEKASTLYYNSKKDRSEYSDDELDSYGLTVIIMKTEYEYTLKRAEYAVLNAAKHTAETGTS
eukprot:3700905-Amphidinium_carterae.1